MNLVQIMTITMTIAMTTKRLIIRDDEVRWRRRDVTIYKQSVARSTSNSNDVIVAVRCALHAMYYIQQTHTPTTTTTTTTTTYVKEFSVFPSFHVLFGLIIFHQTSTVCFALNCIYATNVMTLQAIHIDNIHRSDNSDLRVSRCRAAGCYVTQRRCIES